MGDTHHSENTANLIFTKMRYMWMRQEVELTCKENFNPVPYKEADVDLDVLLSTIDPHPKVQYLIRG